MGRSSPQVHQAGARSISVLPNELLTRVSRASFSGGLLLRGFSQHFKSPHATLELGLDLLGFRHLRCLIRVPALAVELDRPVPEVLSDRDRWLIDAVDRLQALLDGLTVLYRVFNYSAKLPVAGRLFGAGGGPGLLGSGVSHRWVLLFEG